MFTVEFRVNGALVAHIYGRRMSEKGNKGRYNCELYEPERGKVIAVTVDYNIKGGLLRLVRAIIAKILEAQKRTQTGHD